MASNDIEKSEREFDETIRKGFTTILKRELRDKNQQELGERINGFLKGCLIGSLATCTNNIPRSTSVRFRSDNLTVYVLTEGGGKVQNIKENPNVCFSAYGKYTGFKSCRGIQLWGKAEIIYPEDKEKYAPAFKIINLEEREDLNKIDSQDQRMEMPIIKIEPERIRYLSIPEGILNQELDLT
jgi:uncharacterized pyridoxamine 5'-phosphate oxidase family protein